MRSHLPICLAVLVVSYACAHGQASSPGTEPQQDGERKEMKISVVPMDDSQLMTAWTGYGVGLASEVLTAEKENPLGVRWSAMEVEIVARELLARHWSSLQVKSNASDPYLDALVRVSDAGLLPEYVVSHLSRPGWFIGPERLQTLEMERFATWAATELVDHVPQTNAAFLYRDGRSVFGPPPGSWLPNPEPITDASCETQIEPLFEMVSRWKNESADLPGLALAANGRAKFTSLVGHFANEPTARAHGVVWVHPGLALLHFQAGFCAVSRGENERAVGPLRTSTELNPFGATAHGELSHALIKLDRLSEALDHLGQGLNATEDPCVLAYLLRMRGFIYIEKGELSLARVSYLQSLDLAPDHEGARSQLEFIRVNLERSGLPLDTRDVAPIKPMRGPTKTTLCQ